MSARCFFWDAAPSGLADAAEEGWGMTTLPEMFTKAHRRFKNHDDGTGHCRVCGAAIDFDGWIDEQFENERRARERAEAGV